MTGFGFTPGVFHWSPVGAASSSGSFGSVATARGYTLGSRYVDPDTGSWALDDYKQFRKIPAPLGWVYGMLATERGSIPELPWFGSNLRRLRYNRVGVTAEVESAIDEALRPFVGVKFDSYTRKAWLQNGSPLFSVEIKVSGATGGFEIPLAAI